MNGLLLIFNILFVGASLFFSAGVAMMVVAKKLSNSNNLGDFYGSFDDHAENFRETGTRIDISLEESRKFVAAYGDNPFINNNANVPAALKNDEDDIYGELEEVDIPLFKPAGE